MIGFIAIGVAGASLLFNIIGLAIPYWTYASTDTLKNYRGLWQLCASIAGQTECVSFSATTSALQGVRACEILGMLLIMGTLVCFVLKLFVMKDQEMLPKVGAGLAIAAGLLMIIGCVVYATDSSLNPPTTDLHAGFALCIVGGIAAFVAAVLGFMLKTE